MFATYRSGRFKGPSRPLIALVAVAVLLLAGCGDSDDPTESPPGGDPATADADAGDLEVIEGWSRALSAGDVEGAAGYFAIPSTAENGGLRIEIRSRDDAVEFNESLPCGAKVVAARTAGEVTTATFLLSDRSAVTAARGPAVRPQPLSGSRTERSPSGSASPCPAATARLRSRPIPGPRPEPRPRSPRIG